MPDVTSPFAFPYPEETDLVRDGAQDIENLATGVNDYLAGGYLYAGTRYYTSSGTFAKADAFGDTSNVVPRAIRVRMVGGGGGGGGCALTGAGQSAIGGSGSGSAYAESFITDIASLDASVTVTRGAGGSGGAAGENAGSNGANSSFGTLVVAAGGLGGAGSAAFTPTATSANAVGTALGAQASDSTGDFRVNGGTAGTPFGFQFTAFGTNLVNRPRAGGSVLGLPRIANAVSGANGPSTELAGVGGGGGANAASQGTARTGGDGGNGLIIVDVFV
jgi:hypothetical protein